MTTPIKLTAAQVKRLERNLNLNPGKEKSARDYKNRVLSEHLPVIERIIRRRLTPAELRDPKFRESLKAFMAWASRWKE